MYVSTVRIDRIETKRGHTDERGVFRVIEPRKKAWRDISGLADVLEHQFQVR